MFHVLHNSIRLITWDLLSWANNYNINPSETPIISQFLLNRIVLLNLYLLRSVLWIFVCYSSFFFLALCCLHVHTQSCTPTCFYNFYLWHLNVKWVIYIVTRFSKWHFCFQLRNYNFTRHSEHLALISSIRMRKALFTI